MLEYIQLLEQLSPYARNDQELAALAAKIMPAPPAGMNMAQAGPGGTVQGMPGPQMPIGQLLAAQAGAQANPAPQPQTQTSRSDYQTLGYLMNGGQ